MSLMATHNTFARKSQVASVFQNHPYYNVDIYT